MEQVRNPLKVFYILEAKKNFRNKNNITEETSIIHHGSEISFNKDISL